MSETHYAERTDGIETKLRLLQQAYADGHHDLALSLLESLKDTVLLERREQPRAEAPVIPAEHVIDVADLPPSWAQWARGWRFCKVVELIEEAGIERQKEPVDIEVAFPEAHCTDLQREVRVVRLDEEGGALREVVSQLYGETSHAGQRRCRLLFMAQVPAGSRAVYLILYGNCFAELPCYTTDLQVDGEGFGLDIENEFYAARLSRQMGQMESLRYKHVHGLELSAAAYYDGVGHGEPANVDWGHDYLASNRYQKFRVTNWAECPNYEVVRGPLCIHVRRWGFPHGALHPLFAPSRMHMDVQYTFYAGLPYFLKQGSMEMVQAFDMNYLRDDEWVIAGHPFTQTVWIDGNGRLHEGQVDPGHENDLWGVGFFHENSRAAFIALFLEHQAQNFDGIRHCGAPAIDGVGPGLRSLWSRAATVEDAHFEPGVVLRQRNAYLLESYDGPAQVEEIRRRMLAPLRVCPGTVPDGVCAAAGQLARAGETAETAPLKQAVWAALRDVVDEQFLEITANIVDLGYVYEVRVEADRVHVLVTMPHRGRPMYEYIGQPVRDRLLQVAGVREVVVDFTWEPAWDVGRLTPRGRELLGL